MTTGMRRPPIRAATWLLAALLVAALLALAACTQGAGTGTDTTPAPVDRQEAGRLYAQCMRDNGVPDFPDPDANGEFSGAGHEQQDDPKFRAAQEKCRALAPGGEHEKTDPASVEQMREFSQCMRDNGVPDFPDPDADGRLRGQGHEDEGDPKFRAAMEICRQKLPGGGDH
jgi:hypothetical protein